LKDYQKIIYESVRLKEGINAISFVLRNLYFNQPISTKSLAQISFLPIPIITAIKKEGIKLGIIMQENGIALTEEGLFYLNEYCGLKGLNNDLYTKLISEVEEDSFVSDLASQINDIYLDRPSVDVQLDQAKGTVYTAIKRAILCLKKGVLIGTNILCVGDDDLTSVALAFLLHKLYDDKKNVKTKICVFEKDKRFINYIEEVSGKHDLPIICKELDLRDPLPLSLAGAFDCFFTDPPYTLAGMSLFLSRGIGGLKKESGQKVFLSFGHKPPEDVFRIQEVLLAHGLILRDIMQSFNQYEGASLLGSVSQMMVLETTSHTKAVIPITRAEYEKIYTADLQDSTTMYCCKECKKLINTGKNTAIGTIERLKSSGCPQCGANVFIQMKKDIKYDKNNIPQKKSLGEHVLADFFGCDSETLKDVDKISRYMHEAACEAEATIISEDFHKFEPWGVSGAIIIKESHFTIHTWPEYQYAAVDVFTCGSSLQIFKAIDYLKNKLGCTSMETLDVARGVFKDGGIKSSIPAMHAGTT